MKLVEPRVLRDDPLLIRVWGDLGRPVRCAVAGGYLRDRLLGRTSNDLDLTIDGDTAGAARPAKRLAKALGVRAHLLGTAPHEIWRIETSSIKVELWPLGGLTREEDIRRRDFSCNALSWELPDGPLVDLAGGLDDLRSGRLRAISRANSRTTRSGCSARRASSPNSPTSPSMTRPDPGSRSSHHRWRKRHANGLVKSF